MTKKKEKIIDIPTEDAKDNKVIAAIGYLGVLCLVPLLLKKDSDFAQHHGKQSLVLFIALVLVWIGNIIPILGQIVFFFGFMAYVILMIFGIVNALNGVKWEMPVLGKFAKDLKL